MSLIDLVLKYPTGDWNWKGLTENPHIKTRDIFKHAYLPWDWNMVLHRDIYLKNIYHIL